MRRKMRSTTTTTLQLALLLTCLLVSAKLVDSACQNECKSHKDCPNQAYCVTTSGNNEPLCAQCRCEYGRRMENGLCVQVAVLAAPSTSHSYRSKLLNPQKASKDQKSTNGDPTPSVDDPNEVSVAEPIICEDYDCPGPQLQPSNDSTPMRFRIQKYKEPNCKRKIALKSRICNTLSGNICYGIACIQDATGNSYCICPFYRADHHCTTEKVGQCRTSTGKATILHKNYSRHGEQLFDDLLFHYNKNVRPSRNANESLIVKFSSSLIRIIDLNEKTQQLTTNLWLEIQWNDYRLWWDPSKHGGIRKLNIPADFIWKPDVVLYTNADGEPHITINVDTMVYHDGTVVWKPPAIYRSFCQINVILFPYDTQECFMKFGDWSYDATFVDMVQNPRGVVIGTNQYGHPLEFLETGMDLSYFQESAEWDLLNLNSTKQKIIYSSCCGDVEYVDVTFCVVLRRKALFFTTFLVVPSLLIALLTTFVFYLPSCSMKKMTLSISILVSLMVFFTALVDLIPPNSVVAPLLMKYLLFTMLLVSLSIGVNVMVLNLHYRDSSTHNMSPWVRRAFLQRAPKLLFMKVPEWYRVDPRILEIKRKIRRSVPYTDRLCGSFDRRPSPFFVAPSPGSSTINVATAAAVAAAAATAADAGPSSDISLSEMALQRGMHPEVIGRMINNVNAIAELFSTMEDGNQVSDDWSYLALVVDKMFLWIFSVVNIIGTAVMFRDVFYISSADPLVIPKVPKVPLGGDTYSWTLNDSSLI